MIRASLVSKPCQWCRAFLFLVLMAARKRIHCVKFAMYPIMDHAKSRNLIGQLSLPVRCNKPTVLSGCGARIAGILIVSHTLPLEAGYPDPTRSVVGFWLCGSHIGISTRRSMHAIFLCPDYSPPSNRAFLPCDKASTLMTPLSMRQRLGVGPGG